MFFCPMGRRHPGHLANRHHAGHGHYGSAGLPRHVPRNGLTTPTYALVTTSPVIRSLSPKHNNYRAAATRQRTSRLTSGSLIPVSSETRCTASS